MRRVSVWMIAVAGLLLGCGGDDGGEVDGPIAVVAAFYPLAEAAERVGGDRVEVEVVTPPGAEPHDVELTSDQVDAIESAGVVLYVGGGFQPAIEEVAERSDGAAVDLLEDLDLLEDVEEDEHEGEEGRGADPHVWLDPLRMARLVERVLEAFVSVDPEGEEQLRAGAEEYLAELAELHEAFEEGLADCERSQIVTTHDAFAYLADRYGLTQEPIAGLSPESEPDADRIAALADLVEEEGVTTVFSETLVSPEIAETLAREAGVDTAILNPVEGLTEEQLDAGETYASVMRENLAVLQDALGCR